MASQIVQQTPNNSVGAVIRHWRAARRLSQLELALSMAISARHLSCVETGKANPSRDLLSRLADALALPLRERNALMLAGGYAPRYRETPLASVDLALVERALSAILAHQEPYPAFVLNRRWDILRANGAALRIATYVCGGSRHTNMIRQFFDPTDLRAAIENWPEVAREMLKHMHESIAAVPSDIALRTLLDEALAQPDVPGAWRVDEHITAAAPLLTVVFRKGEERLCFFSTIATFGSARDVTLDDVRIECVFPADEATAARCQELAKL